MLLNTRGQLAVKRITLQECSFPTPGVFPFQRFHIGLLLEGLLRLNRIDPKQRTDTLRNIHQLSDIVELGKCLVGKEDRSKHFPTLANELFQNVERAEL